MARQRTISTKIWTDSFVRELSAEEKLAFVYFLTNSHTELCGIYEIPAELACFEAGISKEVLYSFLEKAQKNKKLFYNKELNIVYIPNYIKYQTNSRPNYLYNAKTQIENLSYPAQDWLKEIGAIDDIFSKFNNVEPLHPPLVITEIYNLFKAYYLQKTGKEYTGYEKADRKTINSLLNKMNKEKLKEIITIYFMTDRDEYSLNEIAIRCDFNTANKDEQKKVENKIRRL